MPDRISGILPQSGGTGGGFGLFGYRGGHGPPTGPGDVYTVSQYAGIATGTAVDLRWVGGEQTIWGVFPTSWICHGVILRGTPIILENPRGFPTPGRFVVHN